MREHKFRAWDIMKKIMNHPKLWDNTMPSNWNEHYILLQFTGLKDKNGVYIYEGDITFHNAHNTTCFIEFHNEYICFVGKCKKDGLFYYYQSLDSKNLEVIGNIYQNPELLK